ncbi:MAG: hypothetical protein CL609_25775 [Anaerolineaceae bacterium]|nr:hypothetical protein [Anaerolineaceae bacterium]
MTKSKLSNKDLKLLSNYLDGQLTAPEQLKFAARLKNEQLLNAALIELKQTRYLLKKAKPVTVPRNFTLTPEMAAQIKPARKPFILPVLSISSVLAAILMVFAILFEAFPATNLAKIVNNEPRSEFTMDAAVEESMPMAEAPMMEEQALKMPGDSSELNLQDLQGNPPIINWGGNNFGSGGGGGDVATGMGGASPEMMAESPMDSYPQDLVPPEEPVMDLPPTTIIEEESPAEIAPKTMQEPIRGTGPILGIPSEEETEAYNQTVFEILEQENQAYQKQQNQIPPIRFLQIGLGILTISTALAALWLSRRQSL